MEKRYPNMEMTMDRMRRKTKNPRKLRAIRIWWNKNEERGTFMNDYDADDDDDDDDDDDVQVRKKARFE